VQTLFWQHCANNDEEIFKHQLRKAYFFYFFPQAHGLSKAKGCNFLFTLLCYECNIKLKFSEDQVKFRKIIDMAFRATFLLLASMVGMRQDTFITSHFRD
jgi:hypothetical protein